MAYIWEKTLSVAADVAASAFGAHSAAPAPELPAVTVGKVSLTGAQVRALYEVAAHLVTRTANVADTEAVADIVIDAALMAAGPIASTLAAPAAEALAGLIIEGIANGTIRPGSPGEGQTHETPHSGRRA